MTDALVFDAYGTLFNVHSVLARCEQFWPGKGAQLSQLWRAKQLEYTWQRSLMRRYLPFSQLTKDALEYACEFLQLPLEEKQTELLMRQYLDLETFPDVPAALRALKGHKLAILTNGSPDMIGPLVANRGMEMSFDAVLSVDALQVFKPAPQVYELAVTSLKTPRERIGFVSSNCWDALGAKCYGFTVYWINRAGAPVDRLGFQPDKIVTGLNEILP
ncbi:MAG: haloacid dehalogenase type II [Betaproteobacteria bacterium]|nr:haloacid dehalogenase type II [Betaproteobacteria bacterium]